MTWVPRAVAGLVGFGWFVAMGGGKTLDPTHVNWALRGDWGQHVLGWLFFRNAEWGWPIGRVDTFAAPVGTSIGLTDSLPWLALLLKPLHFLPAELQYIGPWLACCFVLQGVFGVRLLQGVGASPVVALVGGCLLILAPLLAFRFGNDTLCTQWLLLAMLHLHAVDPRTVRAPFVQVALFPILAAGIHPYLTAMTLVLALGVLLRWAWIDRFTTWRRAMATGGGLVALVVALWWAFGSLQPGATEAIGGFEFYSADLLTFFNSMGRSRVLPALPTGEGQRVGFAYLGLGNLLLLAVAIALIFRHREARQLLRSAKVRMALALCGAMGLFALSSRWKLAGVKVLSMRDVYEPLEFLTGAFRASGRFIWPLYYLVIVGSIILVMRYARRPRHAATSLLFVALGLQVWDQTVQLRPDRFPVREVPRLQAAAWQHLEGNDAYDRLSVFPPPLVAGSGFKCSNGRAFKNRDIPLALLAYRLDLKFNGGYVARIDHKKAQEGCDELASTLSQCRLDPRTVYVVTENKSRDLEACAAAHCGRVDRMPVCVGRGNSDPFARFLADQEEPRRRLRRRRHRRRAEPPPGAAGVAAHQASPGLIAIGS